MRSNFTVKMRNSDKAKHLKKLTVDDVQDEQDFGIEDEVQCKEQI